MRSYDAAFRAGSSLGRTLPDPWISDHELRREVARNLGPEFKPKRTRAEGKGQGWTSNFGGCCLLTAIIAVLVVLANKPDLLPSEVADTFRQITTYVPVSALNSILAILIVGTVVVGWYAARLRRLGRESHDRVVARLADAALAGATEALNRRRSRQGVRSIQQQAPAASGPAPAHAPGALGRDVDHLEAERIVCQWMRALGETSAQLTPVTGDGGIDVEGYFYIAQVKHFSAPVGPGPIREMAGVAGNDGRRRKPLFFAKTGYSSGAVDAANHAGIGLFLYDTYSGSLTGANDLGQYYRRHGLH